MNTNTKLIQSALGLAMGMWMIACGGPSYDVINSEKPGKPKPVSKKPGVKIQTKEKLTSMSQSVKFFSAKSDSVAIDTRLAFDEKLKEEYTKWHAESYK